MKPVCCAILSVVISALAVPMRSSAQTSHDADVNELERLRHSFATEMVRLGVSLPVLTRMMRSHGETPVKEPLSSLESPT